MKISACWILHRLIKFNKICWEKRPAKTRPNLRTSFCRRELKNTQPHLKITSKPWSGEPETPSLVEAFHAAFYSLPPLATSVVRHHWQAHHSVHRDEWFILRYGPDSLYSSHLGYPGCWQLLGRPDVYHAASYPVRKDSRCWWNPEITYLQIDATLGIEPGVPNAQSPRTPTSRLDQTSIRSDVIVNSLGTPSAKSARSRDHTWVWTIHRDGQNDAPVNGDVPPRSPVGRESKMPREMLQRDSESPVRRIKILM